ncbi:MAG: type IVB secretion system protein IcmG/DotF [Legionellaceae bacterium]|nr:type IVB secretion system protein IcmG/DotF [Legionellaceae bacterium]
MSENDNEQYLDDEYHFADEPEPSDSEKIEEVPSSQGTPKKDPSLDTKIKDAQDFFKRNSPARNALIAVGIIIALLLLYKISSGFFSGSKDSTKIVKTQETRQIIPAATIEPTAPVTMTRPESVAPELTNKLSALEQTQANMQSQFATINNQITGLNTNLNSLAEKLNQVALHVAQLTATVENQSHLIMMVTERTKSRPKIIKQVISNPMPVLKYYVQAVIPGRAWLIATNGSTLTVREGTPLPGYGVVKIIDAMQGRVLTSSGQVIRFSQDDS